VLFYEAGIPIVNSMGEGTLSPDHAHPRTTFAAGDRGAVSRSTMTQASSHRGVSWRTKLRVHR
jgi:hypothetical protein